MSERKINLEEILIEVFEPSPQNCQTPTQDLQLAITLNPDLNRIKEAMIEFGKRLLELAAENLEYRVWYDSNDNEHHAIINEQSILDTINQIE